MHQVFLGTGSMSFEWTSCIVSILWLSSSNKETSTGTFSWKVRSHFPLVPNQSVTNAPQQCVVAPVRINPPCWLQGCCTDACGLCICPGTDAGGDFRHSPICDHGHQVVGELQRYVYVRLAPGQLGAPDKRSRLCTETTIESIACAKACTSWLFQISSSSFVIAAKQHLREQGSWVPTSFPIST